MEEDLVNALLADAGLAAVVGDRITWVKREQGEPLPAIVLHMISNPRRYTLRGRVQTVGALIQADCLAGGFLAAKILGRKFIAALDTLMPSPFQGAFLEAERADDFSAGDGPQADGSTDIHRTILEIRITPRAPA